jgi:hypothetical protein
VAWNAHRVHDPLEVLEMFGRLQLCGFAGVDDAGQYHEALAPEDLAGQTWACGLYRFRAPPAR